MHSSRHSRREALKLVVGGSATGLALLAGADPANAGRMWCRLDPTFSVDGLVGNLYVSGLLDTKYDTTGPIKLTMRTPVGTSVKLLYEDAGFGHGYAISYEKSSRLRNLDREIELEFDVYVPARTGGLPILVEFVQDGIVKVADKKSSSTNRSIRVKTLLAKPRTKTTKTR